MSELNRSDEELELIELARRVLPAGSFGNLPGDIVIREGRGGRVWDVSGNEYVDFLLGSGPMFIGHCHPDVMAAVQAQIPRGTTFFANNEHGIRLAAAIVDAVPAREKVRFVSSGTEADAYAMRVARAFRGRDKILKFEGGYHGMSDYSLMSLRAEAARQFSAGGAGFARHPAQRSRRDDHRAVQRCGDGGQPDPRAPRRTGRRHRRAVPAAAAAEAGVPSGAARRDGRAWHSADLRRGGDGVPVRVRRGAGVLRRDARSLHAWGKSSAVGSRWRRSPGARTSCRSSTAARWATIAS